MFNVSDKPSNLKSLKCPNGGIVEQKKTNKRENRRCVVS